MRARLSPGAVISARTKVCGVYGHPIRHSASPAMQNAGMAALGLDWRYLAFDVEPVRLAEALSGAQAMGFVGLNLTVPHKLLAVGMVDVLDESAKRWGAVNTIVFEVQAPDGTWRRVGEVEGEAGAPRRRHGFNTDADAIVRAIREDLGIEPRGARVLLLGAGGAGRAAAMRLADEGVAGLWLVNRTQERAVTLAREIGDQFPAVGVEVGYPGESVEIIVNATSAGLSAGDPLPLDLREYPPGRADGVFDMIYRPAETPLLRVARESGCRVANGLGMLLYQGAAALELWTGREAPVEAMRAALEEELTG